MKRMGGAGGRGAFIFMFLLFFKYQCPNHKCKTEFISTK